MQNTWIWAVVLIVLLGGGYWWWSGTGAPATDLGASSSVTPNTETPSTPPADTTPVAPTLTAAVVATHNTSASCWSIIDGNVYDLTSWISKHPGGQAAIKGLCGHDGTAAFHGQHGDAQKQADLLVTMKIGVLVQ